MTIDRKRRPRRIAADEAHAWARNLRLDNTTAKFVLIMLAGYVDGDGMCFVSIAALAEDTELSSQTIRGRLAWLEEVGVIARTPQWIDESGHRNNLGKGRRTSDNIRLLIDLDQDGIERRARKDEGGGGNAAPQNVTESEFDPQNLTVSNEAPPTLDPQADPALDPQNSAEGLISEPEPEPEIPPKAPLAGGVGEADEDLGLKEPEHFAGFWQGYPGHEVMSRYRALEVFVTMSQAEQQHARAAAPLLAQTLEKLKRRPRDAHKWLAERGWQEFPQAKLAKPSAAPTRRMIKGAELAAVRCALRIANQRELSTVTVSSEDEGSKYTDAGFWSREIGPDLLALAPHAKADPAKFELVAVDTQEFFAWRERLRQWLGCEPQTTKQWQEPWDPAVHALAGSDPNFRPRKFILGLRVPATWPPTVEGKLKPATNEDLDALASEGQK